MGLTAKNIPVIKAKRVSYAKKGTPERDMDYKIIEAAGKPVKDGPVGTKKEIYTWARARGVRRGNVRFGRQ